MQDRNTVCCQTTTDTSFYNYATICSDIITGTYQLGSMHVAYAHHEHIWGRIHQDGGHVSQQSEDSVTSI